MPTPRRAEEERPAPGELICGNCGAGNAPTRKFCRRCGFDLAEAPVAPPPPWWRRLLRPERAPRAAGDRPRRVVRREYRGRAVFAVVLALLAGAGWLNRGVISRAANAVVDRVGEKRLLDPAGWRASSSAPGHPVRLLDDNTANRFWAPAGRGGDGHDQFVDVRFREPFRLVAVVVRNGASDQPEAYAAEARPRRLRFTFTTGEAGVTSRVVELNDEPGQQDLYWGVDDVTRLRITIVDAYGVAPGRLVAIAEVDFFERAF